MNSEEPEVAIVILNWNGLEDTVECLESLKRVNYPNYEVVLVDNGSEGNDAEVLRERFGDYIHLIENDRNYGFAEGNNIGMRYALQSSNPDYVLLLNNDTVVDPGFLSELVEVAESDRSIGIVGPKVYYYYEPNRISCAGANIDWWNVGTWPTNEVDVGQFDSVEEVDWVSGCALLIKRITLDEIGLLYTGYFAYFEETEWCVKCRKAGYKVVYVPHARVWHKVLSTAAKTGGLFLYYMTRNRFLFMKRNSTKMRFLVYFIHFFLWRLMSSTARLLVLQRDLGQLRTFYKGIYDGIRLVLLT